MNTGPIKAQVSQELEKAKKFARQLDSDEVKSRQWFITLLKRVVEVYNRNARAEYFQQKYPGGQLIAVGFAFCPHCGAEQPTTTTEA